MTDEHETRTTRSPEEVRLQKLEERMVDMVDVRDLRDLVEEWRKRAGAFDASERDTYTARRETWSRAADELEAVFDAE
jgi:hypothetical protein